MPSNSIQWINWIQAGTAIASIFVASVALYFSRQTLHVPHATFLRPVKAYTKGNSWRIELYNVGPGIAYNVRLKGTSIEPELETHTQMVWIISKKIIAEGQAEIQPKELQIYSFKDRLMQMYIEKPFIVKWETISGKKSKGYWMYQMSSFGDERFLKMEFWRVQWYRIKVIGEQFLSPFQTLRRKYRSQKFAKQKAQK